MQIRKISGTDIWRTQDQITKSKAYESQSNKAQYGSTKSRGLKSKIVTTK